MDKQTVHTRIERNAKNLRLISRQEMFEKYRKMGNEVTYLKQYPPHLQKLIIDSLEAPIPNPLPPLSLQTISYYRRKNKDVFMTRLNQGGVLDYHLTYESLWILAGLDETSYNNYQAVVKQFESDLDEYLDCPYAEVREMAVIVAGNKIIGKSQSIMKIIEQDSKQIWRRISFTALYPFIKDNEIVFRAIFQLSNYKEDEIIASIMEHDQVIKTIIDALQHPNQIIKKYAICIIGNILAQKEEYAIILNNYKILDKIFVLLASNDHIIRKDTCWAISNFAYDKHPSNIIVYNQKLTARLVECFLNESNNEVRLELCHIYLHLIMYGDKTMMFKLMMDTNILIRFNDLLSTNHIQLTKHTLLLIQQLLKLGSNFQENDMNLVSIRLKQLGLRTKITQKSFTSNKEISMISSQIDEELESPI